MLAIGAVVLIAGLQVISAQVSPLVNSQIPVECTRPPTIDEKPYDCCIIPPFFSDEAFTECGFKKLAEIDPNERRTPPDCSKQLCIMKKYGLLRDETTIDENALSQYMDHWASNHPTFLPAVAKTKAHCVGKVLPGPPQICEANKLVFCISTTLFSECPAWQQSPGCQKLKNHMDLCRPYFRKP